MKDTRPVQANPGCFEIRTMPDAPTASASPGARPKPCQYAHMHPSSLTPDQLARAKAAYVVELETEWQTKRPESWARTADTADIQEVLRKHLWDEEVVEKMKGSEGKLRRGALSVHVVANDWERALVASHAGAVEQDQGRREEVEPRQT